ncbi:MAG: BlaI/MecI/CopY family transcriptional regulator [Planctomycetota bacterium]|nr:BlaI/MecI/CopY family transcriptional regulator [Planctomycetota bacterium]
MPVPPQDITDAELTVLEQLWALGKSSNRELTEAIYPGGPTSRYTTVKKLLERLEAKELVSRDRSESIQTFEATVGREDVIGRRLEALAERLCDGSITPILTHMVRTTKLSKKERAELRAIMDEFDVPKRKRS